MSGQRIGRPAGGRADWRTGQQSDQRRGQRSHQAADRQADEQTDRQAEQRVELHECRVSARTSWWFLKVTDADGISGHGECSDASPHVSDVAALIQNGIPGTGFAATTVRGGIAQALADQAARRAGVPLWRYLSGAATHDNVVAALPVRVVRLYANINRIVGERTPPNVANVAAAAVAEGFRAVKFAPFDSHGDGLARIRAIREAVGDDVTVYVDCHTLLTPAELAPLLPEFEALNIGWLEDGVDIDDPAGLAELRRLTTLPLAGGEFATDPEQLRAVAGLIDVVMPDVKHSGGPRRVLELAAAAGPAAVSLHNPSGPIASLHSAHLAALIGGELPLEYAYGEVSWRPDVTFGAERIERGRLVLPDGPGLGAVPDFTHESISEVWRGGLAVRPVSDEYKP